MDKKANGQRNKRDTAMLNIICIHHCAVRLSQCLWLSGSLTRSLSKSSQYFIDAPLASSQYLACVHRSALPFVSEQQFQYSPKFLFVLACALTDVVFLNHLGVLTKQENLSQVIILLQITSRFPSVSNFSFYIPACYREASPQHDASISALHAEDDALVRCPKSSVLVVTPSEESLVSC